MRLHHVAIALSACALLPTRTTAQDRSATKPEGVDKAPIQIAQYPGAPFEDSSGNFWFSTVTEGLVRYDGAEFATFTTKDGLASDTVRDIAEDGDGVLWIGTTGGISTYDGESFTTLTDYGDTPITYGFTKEGNHRDIWDTLKDRQGNWWIATVDGVFRYDGTSFAPFPLPVVGTEQSSDFHPKMVYDIFEDKDGALWFGTDGAGAVRYDGNAMTVYTAQGNGLCSNRICTILQDSRGDFWFGSADGGVSRYDGTSFTTHLRSATFSKHSGWGRVMAILEDRAGHVWFGVASVGGGVYRYDGEAFRYFSTDDGLGNGGVPSIREDRSGRLWFGTTAGVFRLDGEGFVNFTKDE